MAFLHHRKEYRITHPDCLQNILEILFFFSMWNKTPNNYLSLKSLWLSLDASLLFRLKTIVMVFGDINKAIIAKYYSFCTSSATIIIYICFIILPTLLHRKIPFKIPKIISTYRLSGQYFT